jgi:transcriptional regulator with XRE-family HTH domain
VKQQDLAQLKRRLDVARKEMGWTLEQTAGEIGVSKQTLQAFLTNNTRSMYQENLDSLVRVLEQLEAELGLPATGSVNGRAVVAQELRQLADIIDDDQVPREIQIARFLGFCQLVNQESDKFAILFKEGVKGSQKE